MEKPSRPADVPDRVRRRLDEVFGDVLPEVTRDETDNPADERPSGQELPAQGSGTPGLETPGDAWLRANRPPHHDDRG
ncbi:MAG: hypothetical protein QOK35_2666 [Pseudonocardiales bacterium]|jgi:hypothetical protein|nr:hypothetical protein [Pseudonocardiales bacterium]